MIAAIPPGSRVLLVGIGGGGDVVGALGVARVVESLGFETALAGVTWERLPVDPLPGPRAAHEIRGARDIGPCLLEASGEEPATTATGVEFAESRLARHLGEPVLMIDATAGAAGAARALGPAIEHTGAAALLLVDVGGDVLGLGDEPGLASPLCDAVLMAGGALGHGETPCLLAVLGPGCDGELRPAQVLERVAALSRAGAARGALGITPQAASAIESAAGAVHTEASLNVARAARGEIGEREIRGGRRTVELGPAGSICFLFDADASLPLLPLASAVASTESIGAARDALGVLGVRTELDWERENAPGRTASGA